MNQGKETPVPGPFCPQTGDSRLPLSPPGLQKENEEKGQVSSKEMASVLKSWCLCRFSLQGQTSCKAVHEA